MKFKIILSNTKETITLKSKEELKKVLKSIKGGDEYIICDDGVFNPSYLVAITIDREYSKDSAYLNKMGMKKDSDSLKQILSGNKPKIEKNVKS